jgi:hypothetical protein
MIDNEVVKDFNNYPKSVATVTKLLSEGKKVAVVLGTGVTGATEWNAGIREIALDLTLNPQFTLPVDEDGLRRVAFLGWEDGSTVDKPAVAETIALAPAPGPEFPFALSDGRTVGLTQVDGGFLVRKL